MDKKQILDKIKDLDALSQEEKAYLVNLVNTKKKYGLVWEDKPEQIEEELRTKLPVLKEVKERAIINDTESEKHPDHILIEGDNLHALTTLSFTHEGKIDLIYIDPPYNTGNKDFKYNDSFVDREDSYRHSKWLSFMDKRLRLAKRLLADTGVIFISIDDNEQAQLKLLCDEILGEENFVADVIWQKNFSIKNDSKHFSQEHEFVLVYFQSAQNGKIHLLKRSDKLDSRYKNPDNDSRGPWASSDLLRMEHRDNGVYTIETPTGKKYMPKTGNSWRHPEDEMQRLIASDQIWFGVKKSSMPRRKRFLKDVKQGVVPQTIWKHGEVDHTQQAKQELNAIIRDLGFSFDTPKPIKLIDRILEIATKANESHTVLDFFAGSGTTLHATMQLNAEDGGNRQCILVTNNENKIAEEVTYERNKRVIEGYTNSKGIEVQGLSANNLRYYQCTHVAREPNLANKRELTRLSTELLCIKEGCYHDISGKVGFQPTDCHLFTDRQGGYLAVIYPGRGQSAAQEALVEHVKTLEDLTGKVRAYVFSPGLEAAQEDFEEVADRLEAVPLPEAIYNAYRATFRALRLHEGAAPEMGNEGGSQGESVKEIG